MTLHLLMILALFSFPSGIDQAAAKVFPAVEAVSVSVGYREAGQSPEASHTVCSRGSSQEDIYETGLNLVESAIEEHSFRFRVILERQRDLLKLLPVLNTGLSHSGCCLDPASRIKQQYCAILRI
jgi:hypothetical protein